MYLIKTIFTHAHYQRTNYNCIYFLDFRMKITLANVFQKVTVPQNGPSIGSTCTIFEHTHLTKLRYITPNFYYFYIKTMSWTTQARYIYTFVTLRIYESCPINFELECVARHSTIWRTYKVHIRVDWFKMSRKNVEWAIYSE